MGIGKGVEGRSPIKVAQGGYWHGLGLLSTTQAHVEESVIHYIGARGTALDSITNRMEFKGVNTDSVRNFIVAKSFPCTRQNPQLLAFERVPKRLDEAIYPLLGCWFARETPLLHQCL